MSLLTQTWNQLKANRLFAGIYIAGVAIAIATTMIFTLIYYVKLAPVYPENNRMHTHYATKSNWTLDSPNQTTYNYTWSYTAIKDIFYPLTGVKAITALYDDWTHSSCFIQPDDKRQDIPAPIRYVDPGFFKVYNFKFIDGQPISQSDFEAGFPVAVITDELSRQLFGTELSAGRSISVDFRQFRIAGVVRSGSYLTGESYARIYVPYTSVSGYDKGLTQGPEGCGPYKVTMVIDPDSVDMVQSEIAARAKRYSARQPEWILVTENFTASHTVLTLTGQHSEEIDWLLLAKQYLVVLLVLLLVPVLNLSGLIGSRMEERIAEMGIRKTYGATTPTLLRRVLNENLLLTGIGAAVGLAVAYIVVGTFRSRLFALLDQWPCDLPAGAVDSIGIDMMLSPVVFAIALLTCLILNILSALVPALHALRRPIVNSIHENS